MTIPYIYELRRGDSIVATGHFSAEHALDVGDRVSIGAHDGIVASIIPLGGQKEDRLIVQLLPASSS